MKELMVHVERIVRPVRATQGRKLRMRQELLAHLQAAVDEERARFPGNQNAAIEQAKRRLGEPGDLTQQLQKTVPLVERLLMSKLPIPRRAEQWELKSAGRMFGPHGPMTLGHISILIAMATLLTGNPFYFSRQVRNTIVHSGLPPAHALAFIALESIVLIAIYIASCRFVFATADSGPQLHWPKTLRSSAAMIAMQVGLLFLITGFIINTLPTTGQIAACAGAAVVLLIFSALVARWVASLRRVYDEWLTLDI